jgi:hypothetical protein
VVGNLLDLVQHVAGEQHAVPLVRHARDDRANLALPGRVEPVRRLVEDDELGVGQQRRRDTDALLHAEREGLVLPIGPPLHVDQLQQLVDARLRHAADQHRLRAQVVAPGQVGVERRVLDDRADMLRHQLRVIGQRPPHDRDAALGRAHQPQHHADGGRLAGAVRAEKAEHLAAPDDEIERIDRGDLAEPLGQAAGFEHHIAGRCARRGGDGCVEQCSHVILQESPG